MARDENYINDDSNDTSANEEMNNDENETHHAGDARKSSKHGTHKITHPTHASSKKDHKSGSKNAEHHEHAKHGKIEYYDEGDSGAGKILLWTIIILVVIGIVLGVIFFMRQGEIKKVDPTVAATVSGQQISIKDLNDEYSRLPDFYQSMMSKKDYLEHVMVPQKILEKMSVNIEKSRIDTEYNGYLTATNLTEDELIAKIKEQGASVEKFRTLIRIQIYLNDTLGPKISITDQEVMDYYNASVEMLKDENNQTVEYDDIKEDIRKYLYSQKLQQETELYLEEIAKNEDVKIYITDSNSTTANAPIIEDINPSKSTFKDTGDELCTENGKPIIRLYSTTWCPHCKWIKDTFDSTMKKYVDQGKIVAYHWEVDTKDDTLTDAEEGVVPQLELDLFKKYSGSGSIPTFVFGCKYSRIGNGYEREGDLDAERAEFESVIQKLIS